MNLLLAAQSGTLSATQKCINQGQAINALDNNGNTPLHLAAQAGRIEVVAWLLDAGANVDQANHQGSTALHLAVYCGRSEISNLLLQASADANRPDAEGNTPLHLAATTYRDKIIIDLIIHGADQQVTNQAGHTPAQLTHSLVLAALAYPLHSAVKQNLIDKVVILLSQGYSPQQLDAENRQPEQVATGEAQKALRHPVHVAAKYTTPQTVAQLIKIGYDMEALLDGKTALEIAIENNQKKIATYLLSLTQQDFLSIHMPSPETKTSQYLKGLYTTRSHQAPYMRDAINALLNFPASARARCINHIKMYQLLTGKKGILAIFMEVLHGKNNLPTDTVNVIFTFLGALPSQHFDTSYITFSRPLPNNEQEAPTINAEKNIF